MISHNKYRLRNTNLWFLLRQAANAISIQRCYNPAWREDQILIKTIWIYQSSSVKQIFHNGHPSCNSVRKRFEGLNSTWQLESLILIASLYVETLYLETIPSGIFVSKTHQICIYQAYILVRLTRVSTGSICSCCKPSWYVSEYKWKMTIWMSKTSSVSFVFTDRPSLSIYQMFVIIRGLKCMVVFFLLVVN